MFDSSTTFLTDRLFILATIVEDKVNSLFSKAAEQTIFLFKDQFFSNKKKRVHLHTLFNLFKVTKIYKLSYLLLTTTTTYY